MKEETRAPAPDESKCIGCRACALACPEKRITFSEEAGMRKISFPGSCSSPDCEPCELCALACPENAISIVFPEEAEKSKTLAFELLPCRDCGTPFASVRELEKVRTAISEKIPLLPDGGIWVELCPGCRRAAFREKEAETVIRERKY